MSLRPGGVDPSLPAISQETTRSGKKRGEEEEEGEKTRPEDTLYSRRAAEPTGHRPGVQGYTVYREKKKKKKSACRSGKM